MSSSTSRVGRWLSVPRRNTDKAVLVGPPTSDTGGGDPHMTANADLFTPIHKAIRSMIYSLGGRLQTADFSDPVASTAILADLQHEFTNAVSATCVLCLLHAHAGHEETAIFPPMQSIDPALIRTLIDDHQEIRRRLGLISKMADDLGVLGAPEPRILLGARINREVNEFFAFYLAHMNKEEVTIVPEMKEHFTDAQMGAIQGGMMAAMPPERLASYLRWMLPSLTPSELAGMLAGIKQGSPPQFMQFIDGIGAASVDPARWATVRERVGF